MKAEEIKKNVTENENEFEQEEQDQTQPEEVKMSYKEQREICKQLWEEEHPKLSKAAKFGKKFAIGVGAVGIALLGFTVGRSSKGDSTQTNAYSPDPDDVQNRIEWKPLESEETLKEVNDEASVVTESTEA